MTIFYDIALKGIDDAITAIDRITDNTKFAELGQHRINTKIRIIQ